MEGCVSAHSPTGESESSCFLCCLQQSGNTAKPRVSVPFTLLGPNPGHITHWHSALLQPLATQLLHL